MEDFSRELEKELKTHSRPIPVKKKNRAEFYRIDEFGKMTCISWARPLMFFLAFLTLGSILTASSLAYLFVHGGVARTELVQKLDSKDKAIKKLVHDKELLMAQLVLSGNIPDIEPVPEQDFATSKKDVLHPPGTVNPGKNSIGSSPADSEGEKLPAKSLEKSIASPSAPVDPISDDAVPAESLKTMPLPVEIIGIEQIRVVSDERNGDLLVRFDIKNISADLNTISGYIFVVLKPGLTTVSDWLVLPSTPIDKGRPSVFKQGQYFSISHFKPVNFRVKSSLSPGDFKLATIFVYGDDGSLISMHDVQLANKGA